MEDFLGSDDRGGKMEPFEALPEGETMSMDDEMQPLSGLDRELHELIQKGLAFPADSPQRRRIANDIVRKIQQSGKLFRSSDPDYEDAEMETWRYFWRNLWQADTVETPFCDRGCHILARLNKYLRMRLLDYQLKRQEEQKQREQKHDADAESDIAESIPAPQGCEEMQRLRNLIHTDLTGELGLLHVRKHPEITAQVLLMRRGLRDEPWKVLAQEFDVSISTLNTFYERCLVLVKQLFDAGY
jgi:hypothetical protein